MKTGKVIAGQFFLKPYRKDSKCDGGALDCWEKYYGRPHCLCRPPFTVKKADRRHRHSMVPGTYKVCCKCATAILLKKTRGVR